MIIDSRLEFSVEQALTATAVSTNVVDLSVDRDVGPGHPMFVNLMVTVAADGTTADETYTATLQTDDNASFSSATTVASVTIPRGSAAGSQFCIVVPPVVGSNERYLRMNYTLGGTTPTVTLSASLNHAPPASWQAIDAPFHL